MDRRRALEILGLSEDATLADIRKRFRELALKYHPDVGGDRERMALISRAYATLLSSAAGVRPRTQVSSASLRKMLAFLSSLPLHPKMAAELRRIGVAVMLGGSERAKIVRWFGVLARAWRDSEGMDDKIRRMLMVRLSNMLVQGDVSEGELVRVVDAYNVAAALLKYLGEVGAGRGGDGIRLPPMVGGIIAGMLKGVRGSLLALLEPRTTMGAEELWERVDAVRHTVASTLEFARKVSELYGWLEEIPFGGKWRREIDAEVMRLAATSRSLEDISRLQRTVHVVRQIQRLGRDVAARLWRLGACGDVLEWASGYSRLTAISDWGVDRLLREGDRIIGELKARLDSFDTLEKALGLAVSLEVLLAPYRPDISGKVVRQVWKHWLDGNIDDFARVLEWVLESARSHIASADIADVLDDLLGKVIG